MASVPGPTMRLFATKDRVPPPATNGSLEIAAAPPSVNVPAPKSELDCPGLVLGTSLFRDVPIKVSELSVGALPCPLAPSATGASMSILPALARRTDPAF